MQITMLFDNVTIFLPSYITKENKHWPEWFLDFYQVIGAGIFLSVLVIHYSFLWTQVKILQIMYIIHRR